MRQMSVRAQLRWTVGRPILARSGVPARLLRAGPPWRWPWRGARLVVARDNGLGDVLMATPLLREAKRRRPGLHTVLHTTRFAALVRGLPYIDEVLPFEARPAEAIYLRYEDAIPPVAPLAQILADCAGLRLHDPVPDCVVQPALVARWRDAWAGLQRPHIVALRRGSRWTANKDWPEASWTALLGRLGDRATIIEIGEADATSATAAPPVAAPPVAAPPVAAPPVAAPPVAVPGGVDLRGRTTLAELAAAVAAADLYLGPPSGPMHIAAAVGTPGVVIVGGYEHPRGYAYPALRTLYTPLACAPCWLQGPCPYRRACLAAISVADVEAAVWRTLRPEAGPPAPAG